MQWGLLSGCLALLSLSAHAQAQSEPVQLQRVEITAGMHRIDAQVAVAARQPQRAVASRVGELHLAAAAGPSP